MLDPEALRAEVDTFMEAYDKKVAEVGLSQVQPSITCAALGKVCSSRGGGMVAACPSNHVESRLPFSLLSPGPPDWGTCSL